LLYYRVVIKTENKDTHSLFLKVTLESVKSWLKLAFPSAMDLFGIWKQLAQGQTGLIGGEAHRFSRLV